MKRRAFIAGLGGAAVWPLTARAQQLTMPAIGLLTSLTSSDRPHIMTGFQQGLTGAGFVESRNVEIEYRFADGHYDRLPALAADLVRHKVSVIAAISGDISPLRSLQKQRPLLFRSFSRRGSDPVEFGLVTNLNRPGDNVTGVTFFTASLGATTRGMVARARTRGEDNCSAGGPRQSRECGG